MSQTTPLTVAVFGATGAQGAPVVREALSKGMNVRAIARDPARISEMHPNAQVVSAPLGDAEAIAQALQGVDAAFLHLPAPQSPDEPEQWMTAFFLAAHKVSLPLLVYTTGGTAGPRYPNSMMVDAMTASVQAVLNSGIPSIVLQPTLYLENIVAGFLTPGLHSEGLLEYPPLPTSMKVTWTSHQDQARVAVAAMARSDLAGQSFEIGTPNALTGGELAELLSKWVGKPVTYAPRTPEDLGAHMAEVSGNPGMGFALTDLYGALVKMGDDDMVIDTALIETAFGVSLGSVADHIEGWPKPE